MNFQSFAQEESSCFVRAESRNEIETLMQEFLKRGGEVKRINLSASEMISRHYKKWASKFTNQFASYEGYQKRKRKTRKEKSTGRSFK